MTTQVTVVSTKGGVGKTALTANLGGILADLGQRVLLVDGDVQATLSSYYRLTNRAPRELVEILETRDTPSGLESLLSLVHELPIGLGDAALTSRPVLTRGGL